MINQETIFRSMLLVCSAVTISATAWSLTGQTLAQDTQTGHRDEKAMAVLQGMSDYLSKGTTVSFRAHTFFDVAQKSGIKVKVAREVELKLKRPNHIQADSLDDTGGAVSVWYDGSKLTVWRRSANEFMTLEFAGETDKLLDELIDKYEFQIPLADLLYSDVNKALGENLISSEYIGLRTVDGVPCHQLSFESDGADWQIWVEADSTPVPRRLVIDYVTADGELEDFNFTAVIPEGVKQVEFGKIAAGGAVQQ